MYIVLFSFIYVVYTATYVLNKDEIKILENYVNGIEKYDKQKEKLSIQSVGLLDKDEQVIQVISMFAPFDAQQRVDILTKKVDNNYTVYTIKYSKQLSSEIQFSYQQLQEVEKCTSITYLNNQFVVDCSLTSILFVLQNGNKISYDMGKNIQFTQIIGFYDGILGLSPGLLTFFDENLQLESQTTANYIQVLKDQKNVYLLNEFQVIQYTQDEGIYSYDHKCTKQPEFMTIIDDTFYIQCGTLRKVNQRQIQVFPQSVTQLSSTNRYLIINDSLIQNQDLQNDILISYGHLYPIVYDDDVIQIVNNQIQIGTINGYYLIQSSESSEFTLSYDQFYVVDKGLQVLVSGETEFYGDNYQVLNYVSGPFVEVQDQGTLKKPLQLNIEKIVKNKKLLSLFNYQDESIYLFYLYDSRIFSQMCQIDNAQLLCEKEVVQTSKAPSGISNFQGSVISNQIIIAYQSQGTLYIYNNNTLLKSINNINTFELYQNAIVVLEQTQVTINYIIEKEFKQEAQINITCIMVSIFSNDIALVDEKNNLLIISNSNYGWYQSFQKPFQDQIKNIYYINSQLLIIMDKQTLIYENRILRGNLDLEIIQNVNYIQSQTHLYSYNSTKIYQYQIFSEISLSSWPQQIINFQINQNFLVTSFLDYEILLIDDNLYIYGSVLEFTPYTIVDRDIYSRFTFTNVIFNNNQNKPVTVKVKVVGDILKLQSLQFNESDYQINDGYVSIDQSLLFDGPISYIDTNPPQDVSIIQRVSKADKQPFWVNLTITDIIYLGNDTTLVLRNSSLFLFSPNTSYPIINDIQDCITLEQDDIQFYLVCQKFIYYASKQKPEQVNKIDIQLSSDQLISIKFYQGQKIGIMSYSDSDTQLSIYQNKELKKKQIIYDLQDFQFNDSNIVLLTSTSVIIVDSELKEIQSYNLLETLIQKEENYALKFIEFSKICHYKENQYLISSTDGPTYLIYLNQDYSELLLQFTNIQDSTPIETYLIDQSYFVCVYEDEQNKYYAAFYDFEDKSKSSLIIPYFNVIQLGSYITKYHFTRKYQDNQIILIDSSAKIFVYGINDYLQIKKVQQNKQLQGLIAYDLNFQETQVSLKINLTESDESDEDWMLAIYILCGILGLLLLLISFRYIRRYCLTRHLKFVEEKPSEFKSEYI